MEKFSQALQDYWLSAPNDIQSEIIAAAKVKAQHDALSIFYGEVEKRLSLRQYRDYQVLQVRLFNAGLGGGFETADREFDPERSIKSYGIISQIILILRLARREQFSLLTLYSKLLVRLEKLHSLKCSECGRRGVRGNVIQGWEISSP